jgi:cytochrome b
MATHAEIDVWDPLLRIFHWGLALTFIIAYLSGDDYLDVHTVAGYSLLALIVLRIPWGFIGGRHARFADFVRPPSEVLVHIKELITGKPSYYEGHNPLAGWVYIVMFLTLIALALSGIALLGIEEQAGPLAQMMVRVPHSFEDVIEDTHEILANGAVALVVIHLLGVLIGSMTQGENLIRAMITGRKKPRNS